MKTFKIFRVLILLISIFFSKCDTIEPPPPKPEEPKVIFLKLVTVSCTEAFITVTANDTLLPVNITLNKDDAALFNFTLTTKDTTITDTTLQPNKTYTYQAIAQINSVTEKSDKLQVQTLDTTSHNFTWQTFTFGNPDYGSSTLNDVAIIDDNNIWAVGEIYNDTTGQPYNAVHWDGSNWELKKINYQGIPPVIHSIAVINENNIWFDPWFHWDGQNIQQMTIDPILVGVNINKMWGNTYGLYVVGNNGFIAFRKNNGQWSKIESGTTTNLNDIWGYYDISTNYQSVLTVASNILHQGELRLLTISDNTAHDTLNWPYNNHWLKSVWFKNKYSPVYVAGGGIKEYKRGVWNEINVTNSFVECIRGEDVNDIIAAGDYGFIGHFNGTGWHVYDGFYNNNTVFLRAAIKNNTVIIVGYAVPGITSGGVIIFGKR